MSVLLVADINDTDSSVDQTSKALSAAKELGEVTILSVGNGTIDLNKSLAALEPVSKVLSAQDPIFSNGNAEPIATLIADLAKDYKYIVGAATAFGKNILPRVAATLDVMVISDIIEIIDKDTFKRPIYAGNAIATVRSSDPVKVISVRGTAYDAVASEGGSASVETTDIAADAGLSSFVKEEIAKSERPELTSADVIISGGRGMQNGDNFSLLEGIADKLGAAIGASRAAVDAGFVPNDMQVGQTGKIVAPDLYIAVGISGAIQHLAGMKDSKVIVAINKDEDAPIFQVADYGLVADLFAALPELEGLI